MSLRPNPERAALLEEKTRLEREIVQLEEEQRMWATPMTDEDCFLRAVCENPDDDAPRLMYADWLKENGQHARGEFIPVQCELEKFPYINALRSREYDARDGVSEDWEEAFRLHEREKELLDSRDVFGTPFRDLWFQPLPSASLFGWDFTYRRGFVEEVVVPDFTEDLARSLFTRHPLKKVVWKGREAAGPWRQNNNGDYGVVSIPMSEESRRYFEARENMYWWYSGDNPDWLKFYSHHLPSWIAARFVLGKSDAQLDDGSSLAPTSCRWYATKDEAQRDLEQTLVRIGRELAELPPLKGEIHGA